MTTYAPPLCLWCAHFDRQANWSTMRCTAYPDGIPPAIFRSEVDHRQPHEGDGGVTFAPAPGEDPESVPEPFEDADADAADADAD